MFLVFLELKKMNRVEVIEKVFNLLDKVGLKDKKDVYFDILLGG